MQTNIDQKILVLAKFQNRLAQKVIGRLAQDVQADIHAFFKKGQRIFYNERDLQVRIGEWLRVQRTADSKPKYDDVLFEYYVPKELLSNEDINKSQRINIDIVVVRGEEFLPVELKYKTEKISGILPTTFGVDSASPIKNDGAQNENRYAIWEDVRRLEILQRVFDSVHNGISLTLSNDHLLMSSPEVNATSRNFSLKDGTHGPEMKWLANQDKIANDINLTKTKNDGTDSEEKEKHPTITLSRPYTTLWQPTVILWDGKNVTDYSSKNNSFFYNLIMV